MSTRAACMGGRRRTAPSSCRSTPLCNRSVAPRCLAKGSWLPHPQGVLRKCRMSGPTSSCWTCCLVEAASRSATANESRCNCRGGACWRCCTSHRAGALAATEIRQHAPAHTRHLSTCKTALSFYDTRSAARRRRCAALWAAPPPAKQSPRTSWLWQTPGSCRRSGQDVFQIVFPCGCLSDVPVLG